MASQSFVISKTRARAIWLRAQRLDRPEPFGSGAEAVPLAVRHLGYVQIDTIHVIERSHHHILWTRIPGYQRDHLKRAQSEDKSVFEYWTHALSYICSEDLRFFLPHMRRYQLDPDSWFRSVSEADLARVVQRIRETGALSIRDINDDPGIEKSHAWASRKPSKRALELGFYSGVLAVSRREGMLKTYEIMERHFGWGDGKARPRPASEQQVLNYKLDRALRAQGIISLESTCYLDSASKTAMRALIETRLQAGKLVEVAIEGAENITHWALPQTLDETDNHISSSLVHILSPFDPLVIQRKRLQHFFDYEHRFEAYIPKEKRVFGYFALPVLAGNEIVASIDLKADRGARKLLVQQWNRVGKGNDCSHRAMIEEALHHFENFQFASAR